MSKRILLGHSLSLVLLALSVVSVQAGTPANTASVPNLAAAADEDEVVTLRIRSDGWTVEQLDDPSKRDTWHNATIRLVNNGLTYMTEHGAVRLRGSSTAVISQYAKKNYSLEFRDAKGKDKKVSIPFLGLAPESDFVLHSSFWDPSYLRNVLAYKLYRQMGRWAPRTRYLHLVINGESRGLYILEEKIKRGPDRVNLPKLIDRTDGGCARYKGVQGGYIFKREGDEVGWTWKSSAFPAMWWTLHDPDSKDATQTQKDTIVGHMGDVDYWFDELYNRGNGNFGSWNLIASLIDVGSWVDYTLFTELSMNGDGYWKSFYFHTQLTDQCKFTPLVMGPPWDFDLAFHNSGGADWQGGTNNPGCQIDGQLIHSNDPQNILRMPHIARLWGDSTFRHALRQRWQALRRDVLSESNIMTLIDDYSRGTVKSRQADQDLWASKGLLPPRNGKGWPQPCFRPNSLSDEVEALKDFIRKRLHFMDRHLCTGIHAAVTGACSF